MKSGNRNIILIHVLSWFLFFIIPVFAFPDAKNIFSTELLRAFVITHILNNILLILIFYLNTEILIPRLLFQNKIYLYLFLIIIGAVIFSWANILEFKIIFKNYFLTNKKLMDGFNRHNKNNNLFSRISIPLFYYGIIVLIGVLIQLIKERIKNTEEKKQIELEKTSAELEVLKLQISPHFLFNTLNNIRWLARQKSDQTEDSIVKLSSLLRYILYQTKSETVSIKKEIQHLKDFISLHKMRLNEKTTVIFECNSDFQDFLIEPLLFIPFIENVFKYGISNTETNTIEIKLQIEENELNFYTKNSVFEQEFNQDEQNKGLGIKNIKHRLELSYPNKHELKLTNKDSIFEVMLKLNLSNG